jgi:MazG family protein
VKAENSAQVLQNWEALKAEEKRERSGNSGEQNPPPLLHHVSSKMPALMEAHKISIKAAGVGFDWPDIAGLLEKLSEETRELQEQLASAPAGALQPDGSARIPEALRTRLEDEVGDLFFVMVNIARYLSLDPELALRRTNRKFRRRFGWLEEQLHKQGKELSDVSLDEMEALWQQAKTQEGDK